MTVTAVSSRRTWIRPAPGSVFPRTVVCKESCLDLRAGVALTCVVFARHKGTPILPSCKEKRFAVCVPTACLQTEMLEEGEPEWGSVSTAAGMASRGTTFKAYQNGWHLDLPSGPS